MDINRIRIVFLFALVLCSRPVAAAIGQQSGTGAPAETCSSDWGAMNLLHVKSQVGRTIDIAHEDDMDVNHLASGSAGDCTAVAYEDTGTDVSRKGNQMCGPYSSDSFVDTCHGIDTIQVTPGCSFQVSSEPGGKGSVSKVFTESTSMGTTSIGYDRVRSIRVFKSEASTAKGACDENCLCAKMCYIYGDPHFVSFDKGLDHGGDSTLIQHGGTFWAVKSDAVHIQVLASPNAGNTEAVAISGPFLGNHKLTVKRDGVKWDTESVLQKQGDRFVKEVATGKTVEGEHLHIVQPEPEDVDKLGWGSRAHEMFKEPGQFKLMLPLGITIYVSKRDSMSIIIKMPRAPGGQDGLCGNFDGDGDNDAWDQVNQRGSASVASAESLFQASLLSVSASPNTKPTNYCDDNSPQFKQGFAAKAQLACAHIVSQSLKKDCVVDVCTTGSLTMEKDEEEVEVMASEAKRSH